MSSRPDSGGDAADDRPEDERPKKVPGWRQPWDTWRVLMFGGSLLLLTLALARALKPGALPGWMEVVIQIGGYVLVAVGFFLAMKMRREMRDNTRKKGSSPRGRG